jgi:ABC-type glycerol-3-phosphate transport system substrate-binding protein
LENAVSDTAIGVKINGTLNPAAGVNEQYNVMMASGDSTDVVILDAPTLKLYTAVWLPVDTIIKANSSQYPNLKDSDSHIWIILQTGSRRISSVSMVWHDLLTQWGMEVPLTIDDWHTVHARAKSACIILYATYQGRGGIMALFACCLGGILEECYEDNSVIK